MKNKQPSKLNHYFDDISCPNVDFLLCVFSRVIEQ